MMRSNKRIVLWHWKWVGALVVGLMTSLGEAEAATYTYGFDYLPWGSGHVTLQVAQFDPALGTLKKVTLDFTGEARGEFNYTNTGADTSRVTRNSDATLNLQYPSGTTIITVAPSVSDDDIIDPGENHVGVTASGSANGSKIYASPGDDLSPFIGTGTIDMPVLGTGSSRFTYQNGNVQGTIDPQARATLNVTYDYDPIPEASSVAFFALGAGVFLMARRKRLRREG